MKNPFCIATGNLWRKNLTSDQVIDYLSQFEIDGIELTIGQIEELSGFSMSKRAINELKRYKYNSLHSPFHLVTDARNDEEITKQISILNGIYMQIEAHTMVIHPKQLIKPYLLKKFNGHISTENMPPKHKMKISDYAKILGRFPKMGLCLDVSHAYLVGPDETKQIIQKFKKRITQVHFSGAYRGQEHSSIKPASKKFIESIKPIKELRVPIVFEGDIRSGKPQELKKEIRAIRETIAKL